MSSADPRLLGALRKIVSARRVGVEWGMSGYEWMNETHLSMFHSVSNRTRGKRLRNSLFQLLFLVSGKTVPHSRYMIWLIFTYKGQQHTTLKEMIIHVFITTGQIQKLN